MRKIRAGAFVVLSAMSSAAFAAPDWGYIATPGDPDFIYEFDLATPGVNTQIGQTATNFNRGMDFITPTSFYYYVSTDSLNQPGERGLWRWDNGVNTQLATIGFNDSGDGDATLSPDGTRFYVTTDDGDATPGDSLYVFQNLGGVPTFTEIGETGLGTIFGLAMDPGGALYGVDGTTDSLYKIDVDTGVPTLVGPTGVALGAIGGMDFSADGSTLLLANARNLYTIDPSTGAATFAGDAVRNISALSYKNVPEPTSLGVIALGAAAILRRRR